MAGKAAATMQYLSFYLEGETFAVDITKVREVLDFENVTRVPKTPDYMRGVINLRGMVVPVIDLRLKFGMGITDRTLNTCVIIVEVAMPDSMVILGALADSVKEVFELAQDAVVAPPKIGTQLDTDFLKGMGQKDDEFILLLDMDRVFSGKELRSVKLSLPDEAGDMVANAPESAVLEPSLAEG